MAVFLTIFIIRLWRKVCSTDWLTFPGPGFQKIKITFDGFLELSIQWSSNAVAHRNAIGKVELMLIFAAVLKTTVLEKK